MGYEVILIPENIIKTLNTKEITAECESELINKFSLNKQLYLSYNSAKVIRLVTIVKGLCWDIGDGINGKCADLKQYIERGIFNLMNFKEYYYDYLYHYYYLNVDLDYSLSFLKKINEIIKEYPNYYIYIF